MSCYDVLKVWIVLDQVALVNGDLAVTKATLYSLQVIMVLLLRILLLPANLGWVLSTPALLSHRVSCAIRAFLSASACSRRTSWGLR